MAFVDVGDDGEVPDPRQIERDLDDASLDDAMTRRTPILTRVMRSDVEAWDDEL